MGRVVAATGLTLTLAGCAYLGAQSSAAPDSSASPTTPSSESSVGSSLPGFVSEEEAAVLIRDCGVSGKVAAYFRIPPGNDYHDYFPAAGRAPEIEGVSRAFVVVYDGEIRGPFSGVPGASHGPVVDALCVIPPKGNPMADEPNIYVNVSRLGMSLPPGAWINRP
jgi:hypothetical protein